MNHLDHPSHGTWEARRAKFEAIEASARGEGNYLVSDQACALAADVQACYCAGAWAAVVILAVCVADASLRECEVPGFRGDTKELLKSAGTDHALQGLRARRNRLVHLTPGSPALTVEQQWAERARLAEEATEAVRLMFSAVYCGPWT